MPSIPLALSAYQRADLPPAILKNMYFEKTPANLEDQVVLIPRARLKQFAVAGAGPMRGLFREGGVIEEGILALSGANLYRIEPSADGIGTPTLIGPVNGTGFMSAAGIPSTVVLTCGEDVFATDGETLEAVVVPDDQHVIAVDTLNSYLLFAMANSGRFYWSAIGGTTIDALDYATAESRPDNLTTLKVIGDVLWLVGRLSLEPWRSTGDLDLPFQRIDGRIFGIGCVSRDTVQKLSVGGMDTMIWVGADGVIYRLSPNPTRISDHGMEERLKRSPAAGLSAFSAKWIGHDFYVLHIPGEGSWSYDLSTGMWSEWSSYGKPLFRGSVSAIGPDDQALIGDDETGTVWELSDRDRGEAGDPIVFEFVGLLENSGGSIRCNNVVLDCSVGLTLDPENDPMISMSYSDDRGEVWSDWLEEPLGRQGQRLTPTLWDRLGLIERPGRLFRWQTTEPITVRRAKYNEAFR